MSKRTKGSVLSRQKPKRGHKRPAGGRLRQAAFVVAIIAPLVLAVYVGISLSHSGFFSANKSANRRIDWKVSLKVDKDAQPLNDQAADEVLAIAKKNLGKGERLDLQKTAALIQRLDAYSNVSIVRLGSDRVAVQVRLRVPMLCIEADRTRLVSAEGEVYGTADKDTPGACPGPLLTGVFDDDRSKLTLRSDFTLSLSDDEKTAVKEALELLREGKERGFAFEGITLKKYRGYFVSLNGRELEIAVGRAPFDRKLDKLKSILADLAGKGDRAARIELDYQGKAFIKLKKL